MAGAGRFTRAVESANELRRLSDDLLRYVAFIQDGLSNSVANRIGDAVIGIMLDLIGKGISPIDGAGRFPEYKWAAFSKALKKEKSAINRALKQNKRALFKFRRMNQRQLLQLQKKANARDTASLLASKYPYSTPQYKQGSKRVRPVNLFLTGDFLHALEAVVIGTAGQFTIEVGFFDDAQAVKEIGHREGANGQPQRPIIPIDREEWAQTIQGAIWQVIEEEIDRAAKAGSS